MRAVCSLSKMRNIESQKGGVLMSNLRGKRGSMFENCDHELLAQKGAGSKVCDILCIEEVQVKISCRL